MKKNKKKKKMMMMMMMMMNVIRERNREKRKREKDTLLSILEGEWHDGGGGDLDDVLKHVLENVDLLETALLGGLGNTRARVSLCCNVRDGGF